MKEPFDVPSTGKCDFDAMPTGTVDGLGDITVEALGEIASAGGTVGNQAGNVGDV